MRVLGLSNLLILVLSLLAVALTLDGAYVGTLGALVGLTLILTIRVMGGSVELRRWSPASNPRIAARKGPVEWAEAEVHEASRGSYYFRRQIADTLVSAAAARSGLSNPSRSELAEVRVEFFSEKGMEEVITPGPSSHLRGAEYISELGRVMELIEDI